MQATPPRVGQRDTIFQRLAEGRQFVGKVGMFGEQRASFAIRRISTRHAADEMNHCVAMGDIDIELVECVAAEVLEVLLHLHFDIVPREVSV